MRPKNCLIFDFNLSDRDLKVSLAVNSSDKGCSLRGNDLSLDSSCRFMGDDWNGEGASDWCEWDNCSRANEGVECVN